MHVCVAVRSECWLHEAAGKCAAEAQAGCCVEALGVASARPPPAAKHGMHWPKTLAYLKGVHPYAAVHWHKIELAFLPNWTYIAWHLLLTAHVWAISHWAGGRSQFEPICSIH